MLPLRGESFPEDKGTAGRGQNITNGTGIDSLREGMLFPFHQQLGMGSKWGGKIGV